LADVISVISVISVITVMSRMSTVRCVTGMIVSRIAGGVMSVVVAFNHAGFLSAMMKWSNSVTRVGTNLDGCNLR